MTEQRNETTRINEAELIELKRLARASILIRTILIPMLTAAGIVLTAWDSILSHIIKGVAK
jgi:hypothetical protein